MAFVVFAGFARFVLVVLVFVVFAVVVIALVVLTLDVFPVATSVEFPPGPPTNTEATKTNNSTKI